MLGIASDAGTKVGHRATSGVNTPGFYLNIRRVCLNYCRNFSSFDNVYNVLKVGNFNFRLHYLNIWLYLELVEFYPKVLPDRL